MSTFQLKSIECIVPSSGVANWAQDVVTAVTSTLGAAAGAALAAETGPGAVFAGAAGAGTGAAVGELVDGLATKIGQKIADQLYVEVNGDKVWPSNDKYERVKSGDSVSVNYSCNLSGSVSVELKEWDHIKDDNLGQFTFNSSAQSGVYLFANPDEGDMYAVTVAIS